MPIAGDIRLDVSATAEDRISATLRAVQSEMKKTEDRLRSVSEASKTEAALDDAMAKARARKLDVEVKKQEAAAAARRAAVTAAREEGVSIKSVEDRIKGASKVQETFNKLLGLAGFAGLAVQAASALAEMLDGARKYEEAVAFAAEHQDAFNQKVRELVQINREARVLSGQQAWEEQRLQERIKLAEASADVAAETVPQQLALEESVKRQREIEGEIASLRSRDFGSRTEARVAADDLKEKERELRDLLVSQQGYREAIAFADKERATSLEKIRQLVAMTAPGFADMATSAALIAQRIALTVSPLGTLVSLATQVAPDKPKKPSGGPSHAEQMREAQKELDIARASTDLDRLRIEHQAALARIEEDRRRRKIPADVADIRIKAEQVKYERALMDAEEKRFRERMSQLDKLRANRRGADELVAGLAQKSTDREKAASDDERQKAIDAEVKHIERVGAAAEAAARPLAMLRDGLEGVGEAISATTGIWVEYTKASKDGEANVGRAIAGTLAVTGRGIAKAIKDKRGQAAVEGAFETAASIASFAAGDFEAAVGHGLAAAGFFAVAGGAGSSGGRGGGGGGRGIQGEQRPGYTSGPQGGGGLQQTQQTHVYYIDVKPGTDPQAVSRGIDGVHHAARGTGQRAGAV